MTQTNNPLLAPSTLAYSYPPFDLIEIDHYIPAFELGMAEQRSQVNEITGNADPASFDNTIVALERSGQTLHRTSTVFFTMIATGSTPQLREIESQIAPQLAAHHDSIFLDPALFARIDDLHRQSGDLGLDEESQYLLRRYHRDFVRGGARLPQEDKTQLRTLNERLSSLSTQFTQRQLAATNAAAVRVDDHAQLAGMSNDAMAAAADAAKAHGGDGYLLTLNNFTMPPQLSVLRDRGLRQRLYESSIARGNDGSDADTSHIVVEIARLRAERAALLGYDHHAAYVIADQTANDADTVTTMLADLVGPAVANAQQEARDRKNVVDDEEFKPWDWPLATELLRRREHDFDMAATRPYLELERVLHDGVFYAAQQLYGLGFRERFDLPTYHPQVRVFEVFDSSDAAIGLYCADYFARDSKRGGAWMNSFADQSHLLGNLPVVCNNLNIVKAGDAEPTLLTFTEVTTMFHEFGHALHGLLSNVTYPRFSGTHVPRDFVEFPSQVNEMWALWPQVLRNYAVHHVTGEPMPQAMVDKLHATQQFNTGFSTTEYLAAALIDLAWHSLTPDAVPDGADPRAAVAQFEARVLADSGIDTDTIQPRYRSTYFGHVFGGGYAAGYYSYIWSEVLDADTVAWFNANGGLSRDNGDRFRNHVLSVGGGKDPLEAYREFTGHAPSTAPLLARLGLDMQK